MVNNMSRIRDYSLSGEERKTRLRVCIFDAAGVKSAFVTFGESNKARARKPRSMPISGANMIDKRKEKIAYEKND